MPGCQWCLSLQQKPQLWVWERYKQDDCSTAGGVECGRSGSSASPSSWLPGRVGFLPAVIPSISVRTPTWGERNRGFQKSLKLFIQKCLDLHWLQLLGVFNHLHTEQLHFELSRAGFLPVLQAGLPILGIVLWRGVRMEDKCWEMGSVQRVVVSHPACWHGRP